LRRREFIAGLGGAAATWPLAAGAQQRAMPVGGFFNGGAAWGYAPYGAAFRQGLIETGYVEGRNLLIQPRLAHGSYAPVPVLARDLVRRQVVVIAAFMPSTPVAIAEAPRIPIVFVMGGDPVEAGFVGSLGRPGGSVTGVTTLSGELGPKRLELLRELVPS